MLFGRWRTKIIGEETKEKWMKTNKRKDQEII
jgi:hypothetical protein